MRVRFRLVISYLGSRFHGWQFQENAPSIQGEIEARLHRILNDGKIRIFGSGRTDSGVHATGQVAHVDLPAAIPTRGLLKALNAKLPEDIRILRATRASPGFHARFDAKAKTYCYRIRWISAPQAPPWRIQRCALLPRPFDIDMLLEALALLEGEHDFASFTVRNPGVQRRSRRRVFSARPTLTGTGLRLQFRGEGFLRYQVRRMVGALLEVGSGKADLSRIEELLNEPCPGAGIFTAPARGLCLEKVHYAHPRVMVDSSTVLRTVDE